ncbi:F0F1 ATP synthase subunit delta [Paenibacillus sacheonensis]|uniref:ATP synthase subunit delta n=1 Tax=Paenibacillus sacheonensis TaxID=742054 RepID=A0A7X5BZU8_9BACL|nr:F0F1 ATP synthase subunit delta [Paenibacillus sacheonensis]MBM7566537.1 F-type H+-transporting ATPase subunit delta [Paenibacillus sacheonensis]NBC73038.1 F0F1 ATP synthase subunit delta [Paenibacillus sacheonensis]
MSRESVVAKRYAKALFELAQSSNAVADVETQLKVVVEALTGDAQIRKFLALPNVEVSQKIAIIKGALSDKVSVMVLNTVELLIVRGRQGAIGSVYEAYTKVAGEALGQARATIYTAKSLSSEELSKVSAQFGELVGKRIIANQIVEPALLGGVQVRIGDRLYDGSLSGKLARLEQALKTQAL